jgi:hypothetical protein
MKYFQKSSNNLRIYALYDTLDNDLCVCIGNKYECADFAGMTVSSFVTAAYRGLKIKKRYIIEKIEKD